MASNRVTLAPLDPETRAAPLITEEAPPIMPDVRKDVGQPSSSTSLNPLSPLSTPSSPSGAGNSTASSLACDSSASLRRKQNLASQGSTLDMKVPSNTGVDVDELVKVLCSIWKTEASVETTIVKSMAYIRRFLRCERHSMFLVDFSTNELVLTTSRDLHGLRIPMSRGLVGHAAKTGEILNIEDV